MCVKNMNTVVRQITLTLMVSSLGIVYCEPPLSNQYGVPANLPVSNNHESQGGITNSYGAPLGPSPDGHTHHDEHQDYIDSQPKSYEFGYAVKDSATGNDFGRQETSDGETVRGEYRVQLPDGRIQIVTYTADWRTGFHADVRYEGEATYPDQYNTGYNNNNNNNNNNGYNNNNLNNNNNNLGYNNNNFNNYNNAPGYNYDNPNPNPTNTYQRGYNYNPGNQGPYNNNNNNNNYQFGSQGHNQYNNGYSGSNSFGSQVPPRPTYGTPQFH
ncbi:probable WRKY transcription factor protein 1 [Microplitis mediator]|uniref:probable WRKY transcription factor protein 1 n=1 Tax=Microplitis mediator TaxID=375433 RepID=UPI002553C3EF|nr:probable WRKY transcription factor protein 1 [Microplitis mediator]